jgi:hypothetical protein
VASYPKLVIPVNKLIENINAGAAVVLDIDIIKQEYELEG